MGTVQERLHSGAGSPLGFLAGVPSSVASLRHSEAPGSPASISPRGSVVTLGSQLVSASPRKAGRKSNDSKNFKVVIRVRPPLPRELGGGRPFQNILSIDRNEHVLTVGENVGAMVDQDGEPTGNGGTSGPHSAHVFTFDHVYEQGASQKQVYDTTAREVVDSALQGYNATIFAYGQTGTGKTFTMEGCNRHQDPRAGKEQRGIIPRAIEQIFGHIQANASTRVRFLVRASYLQIYNEVISDLLKPERQNLLIREDRRRGVFVEGLSEWVVRSPREIYGLMERGGQLRATGATRMNEISSRSHAVFIIIVEQSETYYVDDDGEELSPEEVAKLVQQAGGAAVGAAGGAGGSAPGRDQAAHSLENHMRQTFKVGKLNLVDLAGSERVRLSGATGQRLEESKKINQSLSALGNVIAALTDPKGRQHIPYRDSKLTRILEDSLGGNCKTTMMAMISPALESMLETLSTVKFASRAKNVRNEPVVNEDLDQKSLLRKYERELKRLRAELEERSRNVVDQRQVLRLEEERRRAEADKMAAIRALEARSKEFLREKEEKRRLEERIALLTGQMIRGTRAAAAAAAAHAGAARGSAISGGGGGQGHAGGAAGNAAGSLTDLNAIVSEEQERLRKEYAGRLAALEQERESIEEEKAQVDRYKQLLLKQRDIMGALTQRLNAREDVILALQDELDEHAEVQRELEEKLDEKTAQLIHLQRAILEHNASAPDKSSDLVEALGWETAAVSPVPGEPNLELQDTDADLPIFDAAAAAAGEDGNGAGWDATEDGSGDETPTNLAREEFAATTAKAAVVPQLMGMRRPDSAQDAFAVVQSGSGGSSGAFEEEAAISPKAAETAAAAVQAGLPSSSGERAGFYPGQDTRVAELEGLLERSRAEAARLSRDLEEVQAEKVSMEFLLREKLERLVQAEIEGRLSSLSLAGQPGGRAAAAAAAASLLERQPEPLPLPPPAPGFSTGSGGDEGVNDESLSLREALLTAQRAAATWAMEAEALRARLESAEDGDPFAADNVGRNMGEMLPLDGEAAVTVPSESREDADVGAESTHELSTEPNYLPTADVAKADAAGPFMGGAPAAAAEAEALRLRAENASLLARVGEAEAAAAAAAAAATASSSGGLSGAMDELEERCESLASERQAVVCIMEQKIKVLVENVADSLQGLDDDAASTASVTGGGSSTEEARRALEKDVAALRGLVEASIEALHHAAEEDRIRIERAAAAAAAASRNTVLRLPNAP